MKWKMKFDLIRTRNLILLMPVIMFLIYINYRNVETVCHYIEIDDDLPLIEEHRSYLTIQNSDDESNSEPPRHIYFHETSCEGDLDARQACVIEAAARNNPARQINVIFSGPRNERKKALKHFSRFSNIMFWRMHINKYLNNTPLDFLISKRLLQSSRHASTQTRAVLRYVTLDKWDGLYLDLNILIVKSLDDLPMNFATWATNNSVSDGILSFSDDKVGRSIADEAIRDVASTFDKSVSLINGTGTMARILTNRCNIFDDTMGSILVCNKFYVLGPDYFYPLTWNTDAKYYMPRIMSEDLHYGYRIEYTNDIRKASVNNKTIVFNMLARRHCPYTFEILKKEFYYSSEYF